MHAPRIGKRCIFKIQPRANKRVARSRVCLLLSCFWTLANTRETVNLVTSFETLLHPHSSPLPPTPLFELKPPCELHILTPRCMSEVMNFNSFTPPRCEEGKPNRQKMARTSFSLDKLSMDWIREKNSAAAWCSEFFQSVWRLARITWKMITFTQNLIVHSAWENQIYMIWGNKMVEGTKNQVMLRFLNVAFKWDYIWRKSMRYI